MPLPGFPVHDVKGLQDKIPVLGYLADQGIDFQQKIMAAGQFEDLPVKGGRRRNIPVGKILLQAPRMDAGRDHRVAYQGAQFRGKGEGPVLEGIEEGFFPEAVATEEKLPPLPVVKGEGPHAVQTGRQLPAPLPVTVEQHLGIGVVGEENGGRP